jgi:ribosome biogenesis protein Nip4
MPIILAIFAIVIVCNITSCIKDANKREREKIRYECDKKSFLSKYGKDFDAFLNTYKNEKKQFLQIKEASTNIFDYLAITNSAHLANVQNSISKIKIQRQKVRDIFNNIQIKFDPDKNNSYVQSEMYKFLYKTNALFDDFDDSEYIFRLKDLLECYSLLDRHRSLWEVKDGEIIFYNKRLEDKCYSLNAHFRQSNKLLKKEVQTP